MSTSKDINEFTRFIEDNTGLLASIGVFATLSTLKFEFTSNIDLLQSTFLFTSTSLFLFGFLSGVLTYKCIQIYNKTDNIYLFTFSIGMILILIAIFVYATKSYINLFKTMMSFGSFYLIFRGAGSLYTRWIKPIKIPILNLIIIGVGIGLLHFLKIINNFSLDDYILLGVVLPVVLSIVLMLIISPALGILTQIWRWLKTNLKC